MPKRRFPNPNQLELFSSRPGFVFESVPDSYQGDEIGPSASVGDIAQCRVCNANQTSGLTKTSVIKSFNEAASHFLRSSSGRLLDVTVGPAPTKHVAGWWSADSLTPGHIHTIGSQVGSSADLPGWCLYTPYEVNVASKELSSLSSAPKRYTPAKVSTERWARIEPFVTNLVIAAVATEEVSYAELELYSVLSQHVAWCEVQGYELKPEQVFNRNVIGTFINKLPKTYSDGTRSNYRSMLRKVAEAVLPPDQVVRSGPAIKASSPSRPYSETEITALLVFSENQNTNLERHGALTLLAAGLGAGLAAEDLRVIRGTDVRTADGVTTVHVDGRRHREVVALDRWSYQLQTLADAAGERWLFLPNRNSSRKKATSNFVKRLSGELGSLTFSTQRLRATWVCHHLTIGTPLPTLVNAAGVTTLHPFARYVGFIPDVDEETAQAWLTGERSR